MLTSERSPGSTAPKRQEEQAGSSEPQGASPSFGERWLGRYWLGPRIGSGGMGTVNLAMMTGAAGFARLVAVKRLHAQYLESPGLRARFRDEIRLSAKVVHPNVVQVLDVLQSGAELLFAMEYVHGDTLRALLMDAQETLPVDVAMGIAVPLLLGLEAAHTARDERGTPLGIVHRDVSPHNLLMSADGDVKILDFGVAKAAICSQLTQPGSIAGKVGYASPEQARGTALDARSDVFSAGVVIWEALTGRRLFRAKNASDVATLTNLLEMEIEPPSKFRSDLPNALDAVILGALKRDREERYGSAGELAVALCGVCAPAPAHVVGAAFGAICKSRMERRSQQLSSFRERYGEVRQTRSTSQISFGDLTGTAAVDLGSDSSELVLSESSASAPPGRVAPERERHGKRRGALWLVFAGAALMTAGWTMRGRSTESAQRPASEPQTETRAAASFQSAPQSRAGAPEPTPSADSAAAEATALVASDGGRPARVSPTRQPSAGKKAAARAGTGIAYDRKRSCQPPTFVDASGIRHFKPECL